MSTHGAQVPNLQRLLNHELGKQPSSKLAMDAFTCLIRAAGGLEGTKAFSFRDITPELVLGIGLTLLDRHNPTNTVVIQFVDDLMAAAGKERSEELLVLFALSKIRHRDLEGAHDLLERETLFHPHSESHKVVGYLGVICLIRLLDHVCGDRTSEQGTPDLSGMDHVCGNGTSEQDTPDLSGMIRRLFDLAEFASITHAQEAVKYLQRSFSLQPSYFFVCLLCSLLLSLDSNGVNRHAVRQICIDYCRKEPDNPGAIRLYLDFCMIHDNGILDLSDSRRLAAWVPYAERLIKIDPCNDYALTLLLKFYENRNASGE
ncbi:MAG: hypothetical protein SGCHY_004159 [Lobulomycetales sp.]